MTDNFIILKKRGIHCARGSNRCNLCKEESEKIYYTLYELGESKNPNVAQPTYFIELEGKQTAVHDSNFVKSFKDEDEAVKYSEENNVKIVDVS